MKELKIRYADLGEIEAKLNKLDAQYAGHSESAHTYLNQPVGHVKKIIDKQGMLDLLELERSGSHFKITTRTKITTPKFKKLVKQHGVKRVLSMVSKNYKIGDLTIGLYRMEEIGNFIILKGKKPTLEFARNTLGINEPEVIKASFDEL